MLKPGRLVFFYDVMMPKENKNTRDAKKLTWEEIAGDLHGRSTRRVRRDFLKASFAKRLTGR